MKKYHVIEYVCCYHPNLNICKYFRYIKIGLWDKYKYRLKLTKIKIRRIK